MEMVKKRRHATALHLSEYGIRLLGRGYIAFHRLPAIRNPYGIAMTTPCCAPSGMLRRLLLVMTKGRARNEV